MQVTSHQNVFCAVPDYIMLHWSILCSVMDYVMWHCTTLHQFKARPVSRYIMLFCDDKVMWYTVLCHSENVVTVSIMLGYTVSYFLVLREMLHNFKYILCYILCTVYSPNSLCCVLIYTALYHTLRNYSAVHYLILLNLIISRRYSMSYQRLLCCSILLLHCTVLSCL